MEYMVELANRLGARPWFSMPKVGEFVRTHMHAPVIVYAVSLCLTSTLECNHIAFSTPCPRRIVSVFQCSLFDLHELVQAVIKSSVCTPSVAWRGRGD